MPSTWFQAPEGAGPNGISGDRRGHYRLDLKLPLRYRCDDTEGFGTTRNFSRGGLLLDVDGALAPGSEVAVSIDWPIRLDGTQPLELVACGEVVRSGEGWAALKVAGLEFRKAGAVALRRWSSLGKPEKTDCCLTVRAVEMD
jgi:hypothetical protein